MYGQTFEDLLQTNGYNSQKKQKEEQNYLQKFQKERQQHLDYKDLLLQQNNRTKQLQNRELFETGNTQSNLNKRRSLATPFPGNGTQNPRPILSETMQDIHLNRYKKDIVSRVLIDSSRRDYLKNPYPNNYSIYLGKEFNQVHQISMKDLTIVNPIPPVNQYNNILSFEFPTFDDIFLTPILFSLYPLEKNVSQNLNYQEIYLKVLENLYFNNEKVSYQYQIHEGFYSTVILSEEIQKNGRQKIFDSSLAIVKNNIVLPNTPLQMICDIFPETQEVLFILRTEEIKPICIQTILEDSTYVDPLKQYSNYSATNNPTFSTFGNPTFILSIPIFYGSQNQRSYYGGVGMNGITTNDGTHIQTVNMLPLLINILGFDGIGGISSLNVEQILFYDHNLSNYLPLEKSFNKYAFYDTITIPGTGWQFQRYAFYSHSQTDRTIYLNPNENQCMCFHSTLITYFNQNWNTSNSNYLPITDSIIESSRSVGRSYPFLFDLTVPSEYLPSVSIPGLSQCFETLLSILGWISPLENVYQISRNSSYKFVHKNTDYVIESVFGLGYTIDPLNLTREELIYYYNKLPPKLLTLEKVGENYYFRGEPYLLLKILNGQNKNEPIANKRLIIANSLENQSVYYISPDVQNNLEKSFGILNTELDDMFSKIVLDEVSPNSVFNTSEVATVDFYENPIEKLNTITIQFYDRKGRLIPSRSEHSFVLEIHEYQHLLKDTKLDSKTGGIVTTGYIPSPL